MSKLPYKPFVAPFTVVVRHAPFNQRTGWGWDTFHFWNPIKAVKFAKAEVAKDENIHATLYFKWRYAMKSKTLCRVVKDYNGIPGVRTIREFHDPNYPEQKV